MKVISLLQTLALSTIKINEIPPLLVQGIALSLENKRNEYNKCIS
jgi:hypothetical protein